jgi:hypothetical protein
MAQEPRTPQNVLLALIVDGLTAVADALGASSLLATKANQTDGEQKARAMGVDGATQRQVLVDASGRLLVAQPIAADLGMTEASAADIKTAVQALAAADTRLKWAGTVAAGYDGTTDIELNPTSAPAVGATWYIDGVAVSGTGAGGAASVTVYVFCLAGQTPGASKEIRITSTTINIVAGVFADYVAPNIRAGFEVPAAQKLYCKIVPNVGTISAAVDAFTTAGR